MKKMGGTMCDGCRTHINADNPNACTMLRGRAPLHHTHPGNAPPLLFCRTDCVRTFLQSRDSKSVDRRTIAEVRDLLRRAEKRAALAEEWEREACRAETAFQRGMCSAADEVFWKGVAFGLRCAASELIRADER